MGKISEEEKKELLRLSKSSKLKKDCEDIKRLERKEKNVDPDRYIKFLTFSNAFINHLPKPFRKIEGSDFKL